MSDLLVRRIRKQRELRVAVGKHSFIARRPTDVEAFRVHSESWPISRVAEAFVVGWEGVSEDDVVGGGVMTAVPFSAELWREWCADRPDFWAPISSQVLDAYTKHSEEIKAAAGESGPGSNATP